ncbi:hypothetical protein C8R47DRAFT_1102269 [Mycena vitilis]|nr:hypothetical protein C8R47DRAFT_1102269 [Mycena vitilis]
MQKSPALCSLPVEILSIISGFCTTLDLLELCQTNRWMHSVCFRFIYHTVDLRDPARAVKCCETLAASEIYAHEVRTLKLSYVKYPFKRFRVAMESALSNLPNLETFHVYTHPALLACLSVLSFPRLRVCSIPLGSFTDPFVRRHPGLTSLSVLPDYDSHGQKHPSPPLIPLAHAHMPHLKTFFGPETFAFKVVPHSRASHLSIWWNTVRRGHHGPFDDIATLALSGENISVLENVVDTWDTSLLFAITSGLPHLTKLEFWNISPPQPDMLQIFIAEVDTTVGALSSLTALSILQNPLRPPGLLDPRDLDGEFEMVRRWGAISPALRSAVLPSETAWARVRIRENVWYPATKSPNRPDMLVRVKWFLRQVVSSPELDPGYLKVAEAVAGKDTVALLRGTVGRDGRVPQFEVAPTVMGMSISFLG